MILYIVSETNKNDYISQMFSMRNPFCLIIQGEKMFRRCRKGVADVLAFVIAWGVVSGTGFYANAAEEIPQEIALPISIVDYDADNLLFQYDLGDSVGAEFAFATANFQNAVPGTSLVELPYLQDSQKLY